MASGKSNSPSNASAVSVRNGDNGRPEFVKYRLTEKELSQARQACSAPLDLGQIVANFVDEGYKVSVGRDGYGGGYQAFATAAGKDSPNVGWTLTARAPSVDQALGILAWKHYELWGKVWPKEPTVNKAETWG